MKPVPFLRIAIGSIFNDVDGTTFIKTGKVFIKREADDTVEANCVILIPNKPKDQRGSIKFKEDDVYCEVLNDSEIGDLTLVNEANPSESE